jgi:MFS family permease
MRYFSNYHAANSEWLSKKQEWELAKADLDAKSNGSDIDVEALNKSVELKESLDKTEKELEDRRIQIENLNTMLWTLTTTVFVVGGIIGAFTSKFVAEGFGRKKSIVFHYAFGIVAAVLTLIAPYVRSPECVIIGRFLFGIQGGTVFE